MRHTDDVRPQAVPGRPTLRRWPRGLPYNSGTKRTPNTIQCLVQKAAKNQVPLHVFWSKCMAHIDYDDMPPGTPKRPKQGTNKWACVCDRLPDSLYCAYHTDQKQAELEEAAARLGAEVALVGAVPVVA